jgi:hypothetical protein
MPWHRNDPDPVEALRRQLAEKERLISRQMSRLTEELQNSGEPPPVEIKPPEPPLWRLEEEGSSRRVTDPAAPRKRNLARQRQRDMVLFFVCIGVFLIVLVIVLWVAYVRNTALNNGA